MVSMYVPNNFVKINSEALNQPLVALCDSNKGTFHNWSNLTYTIIYLPHDILSF